MTTFPNYPAPGCIVEFLEGNAVNIAYVLEESSGKSRLLLPGRKETKLAANRILPWIGPQLSPGLNREEAVKALEEHRDIRESKTPSIPTLEIWELAQGEVTHASALWLAELMESAPDIDTVAAYGRALLNLKTHFRLQPPEFQVFDAETVEKRLAEQHVRAVREALIAGGSAFLRMLWDVACKKYPLDLNNEKMPAADVARRLENILFARVANPESQEDEALWQLLRKGLPDVQHLPLQLLTAWGKLPPHYNFWLDRADYEPGNAWWEGVKEEVGSLAGEAEKSTKDSFCDLPFISIDSPTTRDVDDAFHIAQKEDGGWSLVIALAAPASHWPFGSSLDKLIAHRATSVYLPEGNMHMLPENLGTDAYSLLAGQKRPAFLITVELDAQGNALACVPSLASVALAANLNYNDVQQVLQTDGYNPAAGKAAQFGEKLKLAHRLALARQKLRIDAGAVVMDRQEPEIILEESGDEPRVDIRMPEPAPDAQRLVAEMMIIASAAIADWAFSRNIPLLHRSQVVAIPREYAGTWTKPEDISRIMRALAPSALEVAAKPHAALALPRYAPITSPLRRYTDLVNEAQILHYLEHGGPRWNENELNVILDNLSPVLESVGHIQRYRPRYWKLLYFRQQGDKIWWNGVITEENENFINVSLPEYGLFVRGKRNMFDERAWPGQNIKLRLGKINPLYNEIQILETMSAE